MGGGGGRPPPHRAVTGPPVDFLTETALSNVVVAPTIVICILYIPTLNGLLKAAWLDKNATAFLPFCGTQLVFLRTLLGAYVQLHKPDARLIFSHFYQRRQTQIRSDNRHRTSR
jgi:hypothetical protein